jgi:HK97 family phage portal protein
VGIIAQRWETAALSPDDDRLYGGSVQSYGSMSGQTVTHESALRLSAVFSCVKILSEAVGQLPLILYKSMGESADGTDLGRRRVKSPLAERLHDEPNEEQSAFEFVEQMQAWATMRPYAYAEIRPDGQLWPRHPDRIKPERIVGSRKLRFQYLEDDGRWRPILWEDMLRVPGQPVLDYARDSFGLAQAIEEYGSKSFKNGVRPSGLVTTSKVLDETGRERLRTWIEEGNAGSERSGRVMILPEDMKFVQLGMTNEQAEFVASRTHSLTDIGRWFRIAPYMLGVLQPGAVSYASIEMQSLEFVVFTLMPWIKRWEGAIHRDLIVERSEEYAEFLLGSLLRGTTSERFQAYAVARQWGWMSVNDIRRLENMNPIGAQGDSYDSPLNMTPSDQRDPKKGDPAKEDPTKPPQKGQPFKRTPASELDDGSPAANLLRLFVQDGAGRASRREVKALSRIVSQHADDMPALEAAAAEFYREHATFVSEALHLPPGEAKRYAQSKLDALRADGPGAIAAWELTDTETLIDLAMEATA